MAKTQQTQQHQQQREKGEAVDAMYGLFDGNDTVTTSKRNFCDLDIDVLRCIAAHLDVSALARLEQTCRSLGAFVMRHGWPIAAAQLILDSTGDTSWSNGQGGSATCVLKSQRPYVLDEATDTYAKHMLQVDWAWRNRRFHPSQAPLPPPPSGPPGSGSRKSSRFRHQRHQQLHNGATSHHDEGSTVAPFSMLLLIPHGLVLILRSELQYWSSKQLHEPGNSISPSTAQFVNLANPAGLDRQHNSFGTSIRRQEKPARGLPASSAMWDISACALLDAEGRYLALGRVNGMIEIVSMRKVTPGDQAGPQEHRDQLCVELVWLSQELVGKASIQTMHACRSSGLLAILSKQGDVWLLATHPSRKVGRNCQVLQHWSVGGGRPWSVTFGGDATTAWLAIGSRKGLVVYKLDEDRIVGSVALDSGRSAVYALHTAPDRITTKCTAESGASRHTLFAGCYDGVLRQYDLSSFLLAETGSETDDACKLAPVRELRDRFDPSAIYCLCGGIGPRGQSVAAGTARHGAVKIFDPAAWPEQQSSRSSERTVETAQNGNLTVVSDPKVAQRRLAAAAVGDGADAKRERECERDAEGWTIFAAHPSRSPTYSLVGQHDRLFGVTDSKIWQIDLRPRPLQQHGQRPTNIHGAAPTLAFYRHTDQILDISRPPYG